MVMVTNKNQMRHNALVKYSIAHEVISLLNNMCWFWIVTCSEHNHILAKEVVLCTSGIKADLCINTRMINNSSSNRHMHSNTYDLVKRTTSGTSFLLENVMLMEKSVVECFMSVYVSKGLSARGSTIRMCC